jgi:hypothetical protein
VESRLPADVHDLVSKKRFVSGHDFSRAAKVANEEGFTVCVRKKPQSIRYLSVPYETTLNEGHGFSRAVNGGADEGFSP